MSASPPSILADFETRAEALLEAYTSGTPEAMERHWRLTWHRREWKGMRAYVQGDLGRERGDDVDITLDDARWLVAREHGFEDWETLTRFAGSVVEGATVLAKPMQVRAAHGSTRPLTALRQWHEVLEALALPAATGLDAHSEMTDALLADVARVEHLESLSLAGSAAVTDDGIRHLARLTSLRELDLSGTSVTDRGLEVLRALPRLERVSLAWTRATDAGVASLGRCERLVEVNLMGTATGDDALGALAGRESLSRLTTGRQVTDAGLVRLHDYPAFARWQGIAPKFELLSPASDPNRLVLRGRITDAGLAALRGLDGLFALDIGDERMGLTAAALAPLADLAHLGWLSFDAKDDAMPQLARLPHLRALLCQDTTASDDAWASLGGSASLEMIWGRRCHGLGDRGFRALSTMPRLRLLAVSCKNVSDDAVATLPDFPALVELMPMDVPDEGYRHIGRCAGLEALTLMYCRETTDAATAHVVGLPRLTRYFASYTRITDRTPELLATVDTLEHVTFDSCARLTDRGVAALARLPRLRELRVSGQRLTRAATAAFPPSVDVSFSL